MYDYIIIIPYRNRQSQLEKFITETVPLFQKILKSFKVVIVEQADGKLFNRGSLLNIGFVEYKKHAKWFFNHDVDYYPTETCIEQYYLNTPPNELDKTDNVIGFVGIITPPCDTLGTIIKFHGDYFERCNGYPNNFWGWGVEDKALQNRVELFNIPIKKIFYHNSPNIKDFFQMRDDIDDRILDHVFQQKTNFEYHIFKVLTISQKLEHSSKSGLNNLVYHIISRRSVGEWVDIIKVDL